MPDLAIRSENLGKRYRIGLKEEAHDNLVRAFTSWVKAPYYNYLRLRKLSKFEGDSEADDVIWALRDVNFEVKEGDVVGLIGRNGAGKSTLLKILSQITEPTEGRVDVFGRVASLLEVGTGFHPELSGRENVYLNGTILGMKKVEIDRKFDEIVDFSGIEKFIDTPVKRYSSGMQVRLAFSVAAHLEPEVMLVDEVLAVGDAAFQKKCLGKMEEVSSGGRTVLFVSHNMAMITSLCPSSILLDQGRVVAMGPSSQMVLKYLGRDVDASAAVDFTHGGRKIGDELATLRLAWIDDEAESRVHEVDIRNRFYINMEYQLHMTTPRPPSPNFHVLDERGEYVFVTSTSDYGEESVPPRCLLSSVLYPG